MILRVEPEGMLFGKPASSFPDHALVRMSRWCAAPPLPLGSRARQVTPRAAMKAATSGWIALAAAMSAFPAAASPFFTSAMPRS